MTQIMMMSTRDPELGFLGLGQVALTGVALVMCLYFLTWRGAHHAEQGFADYVARNFHYLRNLSFVSDLLVKFVPLSLLVLAGQPQLVAPLLALYIAGSLVQVRFFSIPTRMSLVFAAISFVVAASQYLAHSVQLLWPLVHFSAVTAALVVFLSAARREAPRAAQQARNPCRLPNSSGTPTPWRPNRAGRGSWRPPRARRRADRADGEAGPWAVAHQPPRRRGQLDGLVPATAHARR